ncbi:MAG TPA: ABC transporter substrate-binding protein [Chloroflexota bacterium]|nr:ABC transporter substrate-binding protein [Chloroflexota bacterium]
MRRLISALVALLAVVACAPAAPPAPSAPPPAPAAGASPPAPTTTTPYLAAPGEAPMAIRVATCAVTGGFVHLYTALEADLFTKYGLQVELTNIGGSGAALAALTTNEIQFLYCAADATIDGLASGIDAQIVAAPLVGLVWLLIARPEIRTVAELRGKAVGVPRAGDLADRLSRLVLERHGLRPNEDVDIRPTGGSQPERYQAMLADIVQGNVLTPPMDARARQDGLNVIYDLADLGLPSIYSSAHASNASIRDRPQMVGRFVAALAEAVYYTEKHPDAARQALRKVLSLDDPDALDAAYQAYAIKHINRRLRIPYDAVTAAIEDARAQGAPVVKRAQEVATNQFADDLDRTGFLQQLWGSELGPP